MADPIQVPLAGVEATMGEETLRLRDAVHEIAYGARLLRRQDLTCCGFLDRCMSRGENAGRARDDSASDLTIEEYHLDELDQIEAVRRKRKPDSGWVPTSPRIAKFIRKSRRSRH